jgi:hypothetical protein
MTKALYQLNLRLNVTSETTASRSFYSDLSYSKAIAELRGAKYCISTEGVGPKSPWAQTRGENPSARSDGSWELAAPVIHWHFCIADVSASENPASDDIRVLFERRGVAALLIEPCSHRVELLVAKTKDAQRRTFQGLRTAVSIMSRHPRQRGVHTR